MKLIFSGRASRPQRPVLEGEGGYGIKLSDALLDVAAPLIEHLKPATAALGERVVTLAALAWNAEIADQLDPEERARLEEALRAENDLIRKVIMAARERKRERHAEDDRVVIGVEVTGSPPEFRFRAAGRSLRPPPLPPPEK